MDICRIQHCSLSWKETNFLSVLSGYLGFVPQSKGMLVKLTGCSKLAVDVNVSMNTSVSLHLYCDRLVTCPSSHPLTAEIDSSPN